MILQFKQLTEICFHHAIFFLIDMERYKKKDTTLYLELVQNDAIEHIFLLLFMYIPLYMYMHWKVQAYLTW